MPRDASRTKSAKTIETVTHKDQRTNIPTEELRGFVARKSAARRSCSTLAIRRSIRSWCGRARTSRTRAHGGPVGPDVPAMQSMLVHMPAWQEALSSALMFARSVPGVVPQRVALLDFSLGGHLSLRLRGNAKAVVAFFAPYLDGLGPPPASPPRVQIHHGDGDRLVDYSNAEQIASLLRQEGSVVDLDRHPGAGHGFAGSKPADERGRRLSKERTLQFLVRV